MRMCPNVCINRAWRDVATWRRRAYALGLGRRRPRGAPARPERRENERRTPEQCVQDSPVVVNVVGVVDAQLAAGEYMRRREGGVWARAIGARPVGELAAVSERLALVGRATRCDAQMR